MFVDFGAPVIIIGARIEVLSRLAAFNVYLLII